MANTLNDISKKFDLIISTKQKKLRFFEQNDKYMTYQKSQLNKDSKEYQKKYRNREETFGDSLIGSILGAGVMFGVLGIAKWTADPKNTQTVKTLLDFGKGIVNGFLTLADIGVNNLLDGITKIADNNSILPKMFGGLQALVGIVGLRWLINPLKIISDIKGLPKLFSKIGNAVKFLNMSLADLGNWSRIFAKGVFKDIDKFFSRAILKVFGKDMWKYLRTLVNGVYKGVGQIAGKAVGGVGNMLSKMIPSAAVRSVGKFLTKIPIVGSLLGFGVNMLLGDSVQKASVKLATAGIGAWIGGAVGTLFPPSIPFTAMIGGGLGDWLGDVLYDKFIPPKLATGGVVSHKSKQGTHVIVAEEEDEVVIPLSMLKIDNVIGSKLFEPLKLVGSNILGAVRSVLNSNGEVYSNISSDINTTLISLSKTFGVTTVVSKSISKGYIESSLSTNTVSNLTNVNKYDNILGTENLTKITQTNSLGSNTSTSVRGLLQSILDVIVNSNTITGGKAIMNNIPTDTPPAIVQDVNKNNTSPTKDTSGTLIATGRATLYAPSDTGNVDADRTSTGEKYSYSSFDAAALPGLINVLPYKYTVPVISKQKNYKQSRTISRPFVVKVVDPKTGKQAYVKINDVGQGGKDHRVIDFSSATSKYFGGDINNVKVYLAPDDAKPGVLPNLPKMEDGGEYKFNEAPTQRWSGYRRGRKHAGEDIAMNKAGTFQSFIGGTVMLRQFQSGTNLYGNYIDIYNAKLKATERIAEAGNFNVKVGDIVQPGQVVSTGTSTGVIHYEIRPMDKYQEKYYFSGTVDPIKYLSTVGAASLSGNVLKNNALASLLDTSTNTTKVATTVSDNTQPVQPIDTSKQLSDAFVQLSQMLGLGNITENPVIPNKNNKTVKSNISMLDKSTNSNLAMVFGGDTSNIGIVNQNVLPQKQNIINYSRLQMV